MKMEKIPKDCIHKKVMFGSGDYYIYCTECNCYWAMLGDPENQGYTMANIGEASGLSGEVRIEETK